MKRLISVLAVIVLAASMFAMVSCGKSELSGDVIDDKNININAVNSDAGDFLMTGSLELGEGEQISIEPALESGGMTIDFISSEGMDDPDEIPDGDAAAQYSAAVSGTEAQTAAVPAGTYMIRVTVTEKATGTVAVNVVGAN